MRITKRLRLVLEGGMATKKTVNGTSSTITERGRKVRFNGWDSVFTSNNSIAIFAHGFVTGDAVQYQFDNVNNSAIGGLQNMGIYYVIRVSNNLLKLASSLANAQANTPITLSIPLTVIADHYLVSVNQNTYNVISQYDFKLNPTNIDFSPDDNLRIAIDSFVWKRRVEAFQSYDTGYIALRSGFINDVYYETNQSTTRTSPIDKGLFVMQYFNFDKDIEYHNDNIISNSFALNSQGIASFLNNNLSIAVNQAMRSSAGYQLIDGNLEPNNFIITFVIYAYEDDENDKS